MPQLTSCAGKCCMTLCTIAKSPVKAHPYSFAQKSSLLYNTANLCQHNPEHENICTKNNFAILIISDSNIEHTTDSAKNVAKFKILRTDDFICRTQNLK